MQCEICFFLTLLHACKQTFSIFCENWLRNATQYTNTIGNGMGDSCYITQKCTIRQTSITNGQTMDCVFVLITKLRQNMLHESEH